MLDRGGMIASFKLYAAMIARPETIAREHIKADADNTLGQALSHAALIMMAMAAFMVLVSGISMGRIVNSILISLLYYFPVIPIGAALWLGLRNRGLDLRKSVTIALIGYNFAAVINVVFLFTLLLVPGLGWFLLASTDFISAAIWSAIYVLALTRLVSSVAQVSNIVSFAALTGSAAASLVPYYTVVDPLIDRLSRG